MLLVSENRSCPTTRPPTVDEGGTINLKFFEPPMYTHLHVLLQYITFITFVLELCTLRIDIEDWDWNRGTYGIVGLAVMFKA